MPQVDNPLKMLIASFSETFATWLLGQSPRQVRPLNVELPASTTRSDLVFEVVQQDGRVALLHIELQGRRSHLPMPWRVLDYMSRLGQREMAGSDPERWLSLHSVVIYTGQGAGVNDSGQYELHGVANNVSLAWQYDVIRLWQMDAAEIVNLGQPAFLPLIGQCRLEQPERILPQALAQLRQVPDDQQRGRLLTALISLMDNQEVLEMVEKMLDSSDDLLLDTPYLRRVRQQGKEEGRLEGKAEGILEGKAEGKVEGKVEGKAEGILEGLREAILEAIALRFNPPAREYRQISQQLTRLTTQSILQSLLATAIEAETWPAFTSHLAELLPTEALD